MAKCFCGCGATAQKDTFFATNKCARAWAERELTNDYLWCRYCGEWTNPTRQYDDQGKLILDDRARCEECMCLYSAGKPDSEVT